MRSLWNDADAAQFEGPLAQRVYTSRLLGQDHTLVLHGGGNTSVKIREPNIFGDDEDVLYVKGSGWDLETIEPAGFAPLRLAPVMRLASLESLADTQMVEELRAALRKPSAPTPSVETILHAILPHAFVDHTHADALMAITNTPDGEARVREVYGDQAAVVPYIMPGFELAKYCARHLPSEMGPNTIGVVLLKHGFFSFGATAREAYERMIELVSRAEAYLEQHGALNPVLPVVEAGVVARSGRASLRRHVSDAAGAPTIVASHRDGKSIAFARRNDLQQLTQQGPA